MALEIEKKFIFNTEYLELIKQACQIAHGSIYQIEQYYVDVGDTEERYRKKNNHYYHTIKRKVDGGLVREEIENECSKEEFENNKKRMLGHLIIKTRFSVPIGGYVHEVDIFSGDLEGLAFCEIEFPNKQEADAYQLPYFVTSDVTLDKRYKNKNLALNGDPNSQPNL